MKSLVAWVRQPTTVAGISALVGIGVALVLKQISVSAAIPMVMGAAVSVLMPDNSGAKADAQAVASTIAQGVATGKLDPIAIAPQAAALVGDLETLIPAK